MNGETDGVHLGPAVGPGPWWTPRVLLLGPAMVQLVAAYIMYHDLRTGARVTPVLASVMLLALGGAGGIAAGVFGRSPRWLRFGTLSAWCGIALPAALLAAAAPIDRHASVVPLLGEFDAEGLGVLMLARIVELPFWGLYGMVAIARYVERRRENGTTSSPTPSAPGHR